MCQCHLRQHSVNTVAHKTQPRAVWNTHTGGGGGGGGGFQRSFNRLAPKAPRRLLAAALLVVRCRGLTRWPPPMPPGPRGGFFHLFSVLLQNRFYSSKLHEKRTSISRCCRGRDKGHTLALSAKHSYVCAYLQSLCQRRCRVQNSRGIGIIIRTGPFEDSKSLSEPSAALSTAVDRIRLAHEILLNV